MLTILALLLGLAFGAFLLVQVFSGKAADRLVIDEHEQRLREFHGMLRRIRRVVTERQRKE